MTCVLVHQLLHGYRRGHRLLAGSIDPDHNTADLVARLSDLSGSLISDAEFQPYLTGYPLPSAEFYALARTWPDDSARRAGCVLTHTLLIPIERWGKTLNPYGFAKLFLFRLTWMIWTDIAGRWSMMSLNLLKLYNCNHPQRSF